MTEEFEIEWIPEDTGAPYTEVDMTSTNPEEVLTSSHIDKFCRKRHGHTNWARMDRMSPIELAGNPHHFDYKKGIIYFKHAGLV